jgi:hypothetical protein
MVEYQPFTVAFAYFDDNHLFPYVHLFLLDGHGYLYINLYFNMVVVGMGGNKVVA